MTGTELAALTALRDAALTLLAAESDTARDDADLVGLRSTAAERYADYVVRFGPLNRGELRERDGGRPDPQTGEPALVWRRPGLGGFRDDPHYLTVMALEVYDPDTGAAEPAPILRHRVHGRAAPARVANVYEALIACGGPTVDLAEVARLAGLPDAASAAAELGDEVFRDPELDGAWMLARDYLAGDVRARRELAAQAADHDEHYRRNVAALDDATPADLGPLDIGVALGAPWIAAADVEAFVREVLGGQVKVWHLPSAANWRVVPTGRIPVTRYRTARLGPYELLAAGLNGRSPVVFDTVEVPGRRLRVRNTEDSIAAHEMLTALQERFRTWLWEDEERTVRLCREYNRTVNTHVLRRHDGSRLTFPGLAVDVELWPWQRDVVAQVVSSPATLCAHAVGAGKTRAMVCSAVTARRLGAAAKPLIAVPAHLVEQTAREARQAYPDGRFLVADDLPRGEVAARCATGEWDAVVVSHGTLSALPVAPAAETAWLDGRIADLERQVAAGKGGRHGRSVLRRQITGLVARRERIEQQPRPGITFDDLGVDLLIVDEAHYFKRLPIVSRAEGVSLGSSRRAADLLLKAQLLRARRGRRPSLALFTGTPWSNTVAETFVWQTFVQPDVLAAAGIEQFDAWAATFVEYETVVEVSPDSSGIRLAQRPSRIRNVPELRRMLAWSADVLRPEDLGLDRPPHTERTVVCDPTPGQVEYVGSLGARVDKIRREQVRGEPGGDNMLAVCGDGRRAALDPRLVGVAEDSAKVTAVADAVATLHHEHAEASFAGSDVRGVLQLVFCDQGTPGTDGPQTYGRLRRALAERGVPAERIRWVHEARTSTERAALFAACREGAVSVLLGSTDKLGVGTNVQTRLRAVHHVDAPWRPSDIEQREGRALRPGNLCPVVEVVRYVTRGTFDAYMWQTLQRKAGFIEQLYRTDPGTPGDRTIGDVGDVVLTFAEVKALATGNELLLEQAEAAAAVSRLRILRALDAHTLTAARRRLAGATQERYRHLQREKMLRAAALHLDGTAADGTSAAVAALRARLRSPDTDGDPAPVRAPWRGLGAELIPAGGWRAPTGDAVELRITLGHRRVDELSLSLPLVRRSAAAAARAVTTHLDRWADTLDERVTEVARAAAEADDAAAEAQHVLDTHRFERGDELAAAETRLARITTALEAAVGGHRPSAA
ncbi:Helicase conserved C-terminal domain-containing protein [Jatrophihabitans endophyticus]|uniref:Helicase conserved C-terminal domain-containing protein n=1 Tax=Jatrophihabitans endophyticus TaxID=1206085 RepID=A0A1M5KAA9_9ACTN|nr:helicase-related protein [Jatrophihabitans endophyticus]SHG49732.1 Helicase conserved C-terminal domain-containing protein [Jatrophihabitans endophyticus]